MDAAALRDRIRATLDPNTDTRRQAELDLKYAEDQPGFTIALLDILQAEDDNGVRLPATIYLKNRISKGWGSQHDVPVLKPIPEDEKTKIRERILPIIASATSLVRANLLPALEKILTFDFPAKWPNFLDLALELLRTNDSQAVLTGLQCILSICKTYRYKDGEAREYLDKVVQVTFDSLLDMGNRLVEQDDLISAEMLRAIIKCYKNACYFEIPGYLVAEHQVVGWCTLFTRTVNKMPPASSMVEDEADREQNQWWKAKKWAYANLNRLFVRYGNPTSLVGSQPPEMKEFAKVFITKFAPEILKAYLTEIEKWVTKQIWLSRPALSFTLQFIDECVKPKQMWAHLQPNMDNLTTHLLFPILCISDADIELFSDDPKEYVHRKLNYYEEVSAPDVAASTFLVSLTKFRKKQTFSILNFINEVVNRYEAAPEQDKNPKEKEGAMRMIGTLADVLLAKNSPIAHQVEYFFVRHVFPEFRSPHGYLRARACDLLQKFERLDFQEDSNLMVTYRHVLQSLIDPELPVRIEAALALQNLIRHEIVHTEMQGNIPQIMNQLLKLANEVDVDALAQVMEDFVEVFSTELTPFAVALTEQLRDTYLRIIGEVLEKQNSQEEEITFSDVLDEKSITALGVLQTIGTLILTLESTPAVLLHLETILAPVIATTLEHKLYDLYNEVFEIIDSCTFSAKAISPTMWQAFELMHRTFHNGAEIYLEEMLPALDNFINYGGSVIIANPQYVQALVNMVQHMFVDHKVVNMDRICACKLAESMMLNFKGHLDGYIEVFISLAVSVLGDHKVKVRSYRTHLLELVINCIYYNPQLALLHLETKQWTNRFFSLWFSNIDGFTRVHDKKLSILGISSLLTLSATQVPESVQQGWPRLMQGLVKLFSTLPAAIKNREEATRDNDFQLSTDDDGDEDWVNGQEWTEADDTEQGEDIKDESAAYLDFLSQEAEKFGAASQEEQDEDEQVMDEESVLEGPLDKVDPYQIFRDTLTKMQQEQPQLYETLMKILNPTEQSVIQQALEQAQVNLVHAQNAAATLAQIQAQQQAQAQVQGQEGAQISGQPQAPQ